MSALGVPPRRHRLPDRLPTQPRCISQHAPLVALTMLNLGGHKSVLPGRI